MPDAVLNPKYRRVLLKLSGEAFGAGGQQSGLSLDEILGIAQQLKRVADSGVQLGVVVGGGNLMRGAHMAGSYVKPSNADHMGMLATVMNGMALVDALESIGLTSRLMTAHRMESFGEPFIRRRGLRHLEKGRVVVLAGGTGNPFVTTDSAAALRGQELQAEIVFKATRVDGVYSADPEKNPHAIRYERLTFTQALRDNLKVMDTGAIAACRDAKLPILVFDYKKPGNLERAVAGEPVGTLVTGEDAPAPQPRA